MTIGFKEKFLLFSIHPEKGVLYGSSSMNLFIFFSSLFEMAAMGVIQMEDDCWIIDEEPLDNAVLEKVRKMILPRNHKKTKWVMAGILTKVHGLLPALRNQMLDDHLIECQEISFLSWKVGYRYRVRDLKRMKRDVTRLERSLIYGRRPDAETHVLILLLGHAGLHKKLFVDGEFKLNADKYFKEFRRKPPLDIPEIYQVMGRELRKMLQKTKSNQA